VSHLVCLLFAVGAMHSGPLFKDSGVIFLLERVVLKELALRRDGVCYSSVISSSSCGEIEFGDQADIQSRSLRPGRSS